MNKHFSRILTAGAAAVIAVSMTIPALAANFKTGLEQTLFPDWNHTYQETPYNPTIDFDAIKSSGGMIIDANKFDQHITIGDQVYEIAGIDSINSESSLAGGASRVVIPAYPDTGSQKDKDQWMADYGYLVVAYAPHYHTLAPNAPWYGDDNNHWKLCSECQALLGLNWHQDINHDDICDVCKHPIVYRMVTVKPTTGGKVTVSADKGTVGNRIAVTVTPDPGYKLANIVGINNNAMHSGRPCFEDIRGSQYHMILDVWDVEIQANFVKE